MNISSPHVQKRGRETVGIDSAERTERIARAFPVAGGAFE